MRLPLRRRTFVWGILVLLLLAGAVAWFGSSVPFAGDPNLVRTTKPTRGALTFGGNFIQRLSWEYYQWKRDRFPNPLTYSFPGNGPASCSIHGLLNQCMEVGGAQYLIEKNVAAGSVDFGSTNVLNGAQWIAAFETALQSGTPQWWDPELKSFRKENLVLLRYDTRTILVLSKPTAAAYLQRHPALKILSN